MAIKRVLMLILVVAMIMSVVFAESPVIYDYDVSAGTLEDLRTAIENAPAAPAKSRIVLTEDITVITAPLEIANNVDLTFEAESETELNVSGNIRHINATGSDITLRFENVSIVGNGSDTSGGGVNGKNLTITGAKIIDNKSAGDGGGIFADGDITVIESEICNNTATSSGGGIYSRGGSVEIIDSNICSNAASGGGGIYVGHGVITINGGMIQGNTASGNGGGIYGYGTTVTTIDGAAISENTAKKLGGGICNDGKLVVTNNSDISENKSSEGRGGGICGDNIDITDSKVNGNEASSGRGGGIYASGAVVITNSEVIGNSALDTGNSDGDGGGIFAAGSTRGTVTVINSQISDNTAAASGGGIYTFRLTVKNSEISGNTAEEHGGGILTHYGTVEICEGSIISGNGARGSGGGISASSATWILVDDSEISYNMSADSLGGGIYATGSGYMDDTPYMTITNSEISHNLTVYGDGGGIYSAGFDTITVSYSDIIGNFTVSGNGAGIWAGGFDSMVVNNSSISENDSILGDGGGIWVLEDNLGKLKIGKNVIFSDNVSGVPMNWNIKGPGYDEKKTLHDRNVDKGTEFTSPYKNAYNNDDIAFSPTPRISYQANGGTGVMYSAYKQSGMFTIPSNGFTAPVNKTFDKWNTEPDGSGDSFMPRDDVYVDGAVNLYAIWKDKTASGSTSGGGGGSSGGGGSGKTTYTVTFDSDGGSAVSSAKIEKKGKLTKPDNPTKPGYTFDGWFLDDKLYDFTSEVTGNITLTAKWTKEEEETASSDEWVNLFTDVNVNDWFYSSVEHAVENDLFKGIAATEFGPNLPMTRAMLVTVLWRMAGSPAASGDRFADVAGGLWYSDAVAWAADNGVVSGTGGGMFAPDAEIARQDMATILMRYINFIEYEYVTTMEYRFFADEDDIADYAKGAIQDLNKLGIINGKGNDVIDPRGTATRAEVAAMLHRLLELVK